MNRDPLSQPGVSRRRLLAAAAATPFLLAACGAERTADEPDPPVLPVEDLMREHGLLDRVLLVYEAALALPEMPWPVVGEAAQVVRTFIEEYHERQEEEDVFPRLERAGRELPLIGILRAQHEAGRRLTARIEHVLAQPPSDEAARQGVVAAMRSFVRMYRAHAAREDTVLFPAFRAAIGRGEYQELGEKFEAREHQLFGVDGFEGVLARVGQLERAVGVADLAVFTPAG
jgi:hemerythrin-like domain-containing protein